MKKLLTLRAIEEGRAETELAKQRHLRQTCLDALHAQQVRKHVASRALNHALAGGDRTEAISAEMALAYGPLQRGFLQRRLAQLERSVEFATATWRRSRVERQQMETVLETEDARRRHEAERREQKVLDAWFLRAVDTDEIFQRKPGNGARPDGTVRATSIEE